MYHGATEDSDCLMLFIMNKPFNIRYTIFATHSRMNPAEARPSDWAGRRRACARWLP